MGHVRLRESVLQYLGDLNGIEMISVCSLSPLRLEEQFVELPVKVPFEFGNGPFQRAKAILLQFKADGLGGILGFCRPLQRKRGHQEQRETTPLVAHRCQRPRVAQRDWPASAMAASCAPMRMLSEIERSSG